MKHVKTLGLCTVLLGVIVLLSGCANVGQYQNGVTDRVRAYAANPMNTSSAVRNVERSAPRGTEVDEVDERQAVTIQVKNANF